ncbi:SDR family oxidoreductase [Vibrio sp. SS-MA-C1-2]|uniref:SDR family oxidoreductase n=1 Tax=Vibrio sp. SS-MA-C1-2 TaxID=2908646 RepID=UPI001EFFC616|nr:SDR family oxidoreductase [Vibrio sp. SS-MA-C1-2]UJF18348.1 SDR family oxidoreductase [Vibrio sp. SS-MA-C1-2]
MIILIVGGNGGIGKALLIALLQQFPLAQIHATYHSSNPDFNKSDLLTLETVIWYQLDVTKENQVQALSAQFERIDWIINCVGALHIYDRGPEKRITEATKDHFIHSMTINTLPTLLLANYFDKSLRLSKQAKFATISAKVGSITDNQLGGWYSYRASKAALNMLLKTLAIEWKKTNKNATVLSIHPGTTDTPLSKPFHKNIPAEKLFTPEKVAKDIIKLLLESTPELSGSFLAYDGEHLLW